jgi:hypothetical protein
MAASPKSLTIRTQDASASADSLPPVYFYYPRAIAGAGALKTVDTFAYQPGIYVWTVNTYGYLSRLGFPCQLTDRLPEDGIIVTHRQLLRNTMTPGPRQVFVCIVADFYRHPFAQLHTVQNGQDPLLKRPSQTWPAAFVPLWTETELIPRDPARGDTFANVSYFGLPTRLAPQLRSAAFVKLLRRHGFNFRIVDRHRWNDYSDTDAVLAVRSFARVSYHKFPPTKLYNSWMAGVPALLGRESAYRAERRGDLDYFEVGGVDEILQTLLRLRADPGLRAAIARNCETRAAGVTPERIGRGWIEFLTKTAAPAYASWRRQSTARRRAFLIRRAFHYVAFVCADLVVRAQGYVRKRLRALRP